jgi:hypothetical protein
MGSRDGAGFSSSKELHPVHAPSSFGSSIPTSPRQQAGYHTRNASSLSSASKVSLHLGMLRLHGPKQKRRYWTGVYTCITLSISPSLFPFPASHFSLLLSLLDSDTRAWMHNSLLSRHTQSLSSSQCLYPGRPIGEEYGRTRPSLRCPLPEFAS